MQAVVGPAAHMGTGIFGPSASCYNPDSRGHFYDPDLARQYLAESTYGSGANVPVILADLSRGSFINMSVAIKEYWKDNLNIELDILRRESGMPRRDNTQLRRYSEAAWVPDPTQVMTTFTAKDIGVLDPVPGAYEVMDALHEYARSLPLDHPDRCKAYQAVETEWFRQSLRDTVPVVRVLELRDQALGAGLRDQLQHQSQPLGHVRREALGTRRPPTQGDNWRS